MELVLKTKQVQKNDKAAFSKCFPGAGYMKVGGGFGSEVKLSSVLSVRAISGVLGYPSLEKEIRNFDPQGCNDRIMTQTLNMINE